MASYPIYSKSVKHKTSILDPSPTELSEAMCHSACRPRRAGQTRFHHDKCPGADQDGGGEMLPRIWAMQRSKRNIPHHEMQIPIRSECSVEPSETCDGKAERFNFFECGSHPYRMIHIASLPSLSPTPSVGTLSVA